MNPLFLLTLNRMVRRLLAANLFATRYLSPHKDKSFLVRVEGLPPLYATIKAADNIQWSTEERSVELTISGDSKAFSRTIRAILNKRPTMALGLKMTGDMALAADLQMCAAHWDIDWSELVSPFVGTTMSFWVAEGGERFFKAARQGLKSCLKTSIRYMQEEQPILPSRPEYEQWSQEVTQCRQASERLEARLNKYQKKESKNHGAI